MLVVGWMAASECGALFGVAEIVDEIAHLGYPPYFRYLLAAAKIAEAAGLTLRVSARLREWAYAGAAFELLAAAASYATVEGFGSGSFAPPLGFLGLLGASYDVRQANRLVAQ